MNPGDPGGMGLDRRAGDSALNGSLLTCHAAKPGASGEVENHQRADEVVLRSQLCG